MTINKEMLEDIKELMEEDFSILIDTFIVDCDKRIIDLKTAISNQDDKEVREIAHGFKGSSSNLGAVTLAEVSFTLETMGRTAKLEGAEESFQELEEEYLIVKKYFTSLL